MILVNVKQSKKCGFCKHWYDPTNSAIEPKALKINLWKLDERASNYCEIRKRETRATYNCEEYSCKV